MISSGVHMATIVPSSRIVVVSVSSGERFPIERQ